MGGYGSGRRGGWERPIVEHSTVLDVDRLVRQGLIAPGLSRSGSLTWRNVDTGEETNSVGFVVDTTEGDRGRFDLSYRLGSERRSVECPVRLQTSRPHFGGVRWWFVCSWCQHRRWRLYRPSFDEWACRECHRLTYRSRQDHNRASRHGSGRRALRRWLDQDETLCKRAARRNLRRRLSRWRQQNRCSCVSRRAAEDGE